MYFRRRVIRGVPCLAGRSTASIPCICTSFNRTGEDRSLSFDVFRPRMGYILTHYTGTGELALDGIQATMIPVRRLSEPKLLEIERIAHKAIERPIHTVQRFADVQDGDYRLRFNPAGSTFASFIEREPAPIMTAVYTLPPPERAIARGAHPPGGCRSPSPATKPASCGLLWTRYRTFTCFSSTKASPTWTCMKSCYIARRLTTIEAGARA